MSLQLPGKRFSANAGGSVLLTGDASHKSRGCRAFPPYRADGSSALNDRITPGRCAVVVCLATLDPGSIERIEVVRGPFSAVYGSDAIGGVINIITREGGVGFR